MALHWDGAAWSSVPMPPIETTGTQGVEIDDVEALAPDDVWATGNLVSYDDEIPTEPLLLHWNGSEWALEEGPAAGEPRGELVQVGAELWSLGERLWHFDGETWQSEAGPTHGVPLGGAALDDGRLFVVGGKGRGSPYLLPFAVTRNP